ncbi:DUF4249 domain-containing protein [uncultured Draconibacterium sp.]|uniref:DUF4249 domain-containing protein n=1 Tax=uncultured Draconibacterium sp. TaxID=1573823 RepID=UPI0032178C70
MTGKLSFIFFLFIILFASCEKEVTLDFDHESKLTFNCILNPDSIIHASLTQSQEIGGPGDFNAIKDAEIKLSEDDSIIGLLTDTGNGKYSIQYKPKPGKTYKVDIYKKNFPRAKATTTVPEGVKIEFIQKTPQPDEYKRHLVEVKINDREGKNYYWYYSYTWRINYQDKLTSGYYNIYCPYFDDFNKKIEPEMKYGYYYDYMIRIKDSENDGNILSWNTYALKNDESDYYRVVLEVDKHYDKYLKTSVQMRMQENQTIALNEPVSIYTNIENGYGIFGANLVTQKMY